MPAMTDPMDALRFFQMALRAGDVTTQPAKLHPGLLIHFDQPQGVPRFTYARVAKSKVQAVCLFAGAEPIEGHLCWGLGYAVSPELRGRGVGTEVVCQAIEDHAAGLRRAKVPSFYIEAVVARDNIASQRIAAKALQSEGEEGEDALSGTPSFRYLRFFGPEA